MLETLIEFSEVTPVKLIISQIIIWSIAIQWTWNLIKKDEKKV